MLFLVDPNSYSVKKSISPLFQSFIDLIFPRHCYGCSAALRFYENKLCLSCQISLPLTSLHLTRENPLYQKLSTRFPLKATTSLFYFEKEGVLARLIYLLKYNGVYQLGTFLGEWLAEHLKESPFFDSIDGIIPVPLHPKRKRKRGYNQAELIAEAVAHQLKVPLYSEVLKRIRNTTSLVLLGEKERENEITAAIRCIKKIENAQHLLLIDDVLTTGTTLNTCAQSLRKEQTLKLSIAVVGCRL